MKDWQNVPLGELLKKSDNWIELDPIEQYKEVTVRLWGKGVVLRREVSGAEIASKKRLRVKAGQFILSRIDARNGAFGLIPPELEGAVVSNDFPVFEVNQSKLLPDFLGWLSRTHNFVDFCLRASEGTTNRVRLKEKKFLATEIMLPPLSEQQRIVAKIEQLAAKVEEAQKLKEQTELTISALTFACSAKFFEAVKWPLLKLQEITERITKGESPSWQGFSYQDVGPIFVRSQNVLWGKFNLQEVKHISTDFHSKLSRSQLRPYDVLINLVGASIGRSCVVPENIREANINQAVAVITPQKDKLDSSYLMRFLLSPPTQEIIHGGKVETARPNISLRDLARLQIPLPPLEEQRRVVAYLDNLQGKVDSLRNLQTQTQTELDALLPSILDKAFKGKL